MDQEIFTQCRAQWPALQVDQASFAAYAADSRVLDPRFASDLYLACACAKGDEIAIGLCEQTFFPETERALRRQRIGPEQLREVVQRLRIKLFVASDSDTTGYISAYRGRGRLGAWIRVIAVRMAIKMLQKERREQAAEPDELVRELDKESDGPTPEEQHLKLVYRAEFRAAFVEAIAKMNSRDRDLLRGHFVERKSIDTLGEEHGVHRSTAARWVEQAKDALAKAIRDAMTQKLALNRADYESIVRIAQSRLDLSLRYFMRGDGD